MLRFVPRSTLAVAQPKKVTGLSRRMMEPTEYVSREEDKILEAAVHSFGTSTRSGSI